MGEEISLTPRCADALQPAGQAGWRKPGGQGQGRQAGEGDRIGNGQPVDIGFKPDAVAFGNVAFLNRVGRNNRGGCQQQVNTLHEQGGTIKQSAPQAFGPGNFRTAKGEAFFNVPDHFRFQLIPVVGVKLMQ